MNVARRDEDLKKMSFTSFSPAPLETKMLSMFFFEGTADFRINCHVSWEGKLAEKATSVADDSNATGNSIL